MGVIQCPEHGLRGIAFVCPHLDEAFRKSESLPEMILVSAEFEDVKLSAMLCKVCADNAAADGGGYKRFGEPGLDWYFELKIEPICPACLETAKSKL